MATITMLATGYLSGRGTIPFACITSRKLCHKPKGGDFKDEETGAQEIGA